MGNGTPENRPGPAFPRPAPPRACPPAPRRQQVPRHWQMNWGRRSIGPHPPVPGQNTVPGGQVVVVVVVGAAVVVVVVGAGVVVVVGGGQATAVPLPHSPGGRQRELPLP